MTKVVTRFAPSPTGFLHLGGVRTFLYNYLFAKQNNGIFYVRIEDTDQTRYVKEAEDYIQETFKWLNIKLDHSPWNPDPSIGSYYQSKRDYSKYVKYLLETGNAYYAFDTPEEIENTRKENKYFAYDASTRMGMRNSLSLSQSEVEELLANGAPYVIRFKVEPNQMITFEDLVHGSITVNSNQIDDRVLIKSNGIAAYHLANTCDDHDMGTTHVIRGEEWISSTPLHVLLYKAFNWDLPKFAHLPSILAPDGKGKLSKRHALKYNMPVFPFGGQALDEKGNLASYVGLKDEGILPEATLNFLAFLGWTGSKEILSIDELIQEFDLSHVHKTGAKFDYTKLKWYNSEYIKALPNYDVIKMIDNPKLSKFSLSELDMICDICKNRATLISDMTLVSKIFTDEFEPNLDKVTEDFIHVFRKFVDTNILWNINDIKNTINDICVNSNIKIGKLMPILRQVLVNGISGPDLITTMYIIGVDETKRRLTKAL